jgi:hypothetical protein
VSKLNLVVLVEVAAEEILGQVLRELQVKEIMEVTLIQVKIQVEMQAEAEAVQAQPVEMPHMLQVKILRVTVVQELLRHYLALQ